MRNNTNNVHLPNNLHLPNHATTATLLAAYARIANTNGLRPIPVNNNLDIPNPDTSVVNNNLNVPTHDVSVPIPNTSAVILDNAPDAHPTPPLLGAEEQHTPTE